MSLTNSSIALLVIYAIICLAIGFWSARKQKTSDYMLASRKLTTWELIGTFVASYIGGGALVATTAYVYKYGISTVFIYVGVALGYLILAHYAPRIRQAGQKKNLHTLASWISYRIGPRAGKLTAIVILIAWIGSLFNQFIAGSSVLSYLSGWSYEVVLLASGTVILVYLLLGGFRSVVRTDLFQYVVFLLLFVVLGYYAIGNQGVSKELLTIGGLGPTLIVAAFVYGIISQIGGAPEWQRILAAKDDKTIRRALYGSAIAIILAGFALSLVGLAAGSRLPGLDPNIAFAAGLSTLVPPALLGFGLVLIFAAIMSSADTIIFLLSASLTKDFSKKKKQTDSDMMVRTRWFVVLFTLIGMIGAYFFRDIISVILVIIAVAAILVPAILVSFYNTKVSENAIIFSIVIGLIYVASLMITGRIEPELSVGSFIPAGIALLCWQGVTRLFRSLRTRK